MSDKKKTDKTEIKSLREKLDAITFNDKQANKRLKASLARNRQRRVGGASRISGLGGLRGLQTIQNKYKNK